MPEKLQKRDRPWFKWDSPMERLKRKEVLAENWKALWFDSHKWEPTIKRMIPLKGISEKLAYEIRQGYRHYIEWSDRFTGITDVVFSSFPDQFYEQARKYARLRNAVSAAGKKYRRQLRSNTAKSITTTRPKDLHALMAKTMGRMQVGAFVIILALGAMWIYMNTKDDGKCQTD